MSSDYVPLSGQGKCPSRDGLNKSVDCSSTHRKSSRADGLFRDSLGHCNLDSTDLAATKGS